MTRDFYFSFFHNSVSPGPLSISLGPVSNFFRIFAEIFANECLSAGPGILNAMLAFIYVGLQIRLVQKGGGGGHPFLKISKPT